MLEPGTLVAGYRVERVLGSGGMGAVFLARHPELPRYDALKVLKASAGLTDSNFRRRFLREAEVAATLDHPNIVTVFNRGRASVPTQSVSKQAEADLLWIAMQYVPGTDCARELAGRGRIAPRRVVHIVSEVARGIDHANRRGLFHRDVKPANILLAEVDEDSSFDEQRVLLTDFGVAKLSDETEALTSVGTVLATLSYASPEQLTGRRLDGRTDQYSLAATTFHLLTGRVPFDDRDNGAVIGAHLKEPVPRVSDLVPGLSLEADAVLARAMAKTPDDRFVSCREFADALATSLRSVRPRSVADLDAETVRGIPGSRRAPETAGPPGRATTPPPDRMNPDRMNPDRTNPDRLPPDRLPPDRRRSRPGPPGRGGSVPGLPAANQDPALEATQRAAPARGAPAGRPSDRGPVRSPRPDQRPRPDRSAGPGQRSRPTTGADPAVWQHPPSNPFRQSNDHLRPDGAPPNPGGPSRSPGVAAQRGVIPGPGPRDSAGSGRPASNRLPVVLAVVAVLLLVAIVVVFLML